MKKLIAKIVCLGAFLAVFAPIAAHATPISGSVSITGLSDTFTGTSLTFASVPPLPATGLVLGSSIAGILPLSPITVGSIASFATASGITLFTDGVTKFVLNGPVSVISYTGSFLNITGTGMFSTTLPNYSSTSGTFNLTSTVNGLTSFTLDSSVAATPEPSSLVLLGTGLVSAAGMLVRRRRAAGMVA